MKRIYSWLLLLTLVLGLCACGQSEETQWQEQYDLGVRYLSEGNYEEAIIAFTAAIEIDPKQPDAYLKASEAHMGMGDTEAAISILEEGFAETNNEEIQSRLDEIMSTNDSVDGEEVLQFPLTYQILDSGGIVPEVEDIYYEVNTIDGKVTFKEAGKDYEFVNPYTVTVKVTAKSQWGTIEGYNDASSTITLTVPAID